MSCLLMDVRRRWVGRRLLEVRNVRGFHQVCLVWGKVGDKSGVWRTCANGCALHGTYRYILYLTYTSCGELEAVILAPTNSCQNSGTSMPHCDTRPGPQLGCPLSAVRRPRRLRFQSPEFILQTRGPSCDITNLGTRHASSLRVGSWPPLFLFPFRFLFSTCSCQIMTALSEGWGQVCIHADRNEWLNHNSAKYLYSQIRRGKHRAYQANNSLPRLPQSAAVRTRFIILLPRPIPLQVPSTK